MSLIKRRVVDLVASRMASIARIVRTENISEQFQMLDLESDALRHADWVAGQKVGLLLDGEKRCYTPVFIENATGRMRLLIYLHNQGPGSEWAASAKVSDECRFMGPRPSLDLSKINGPSVLFGDETSFAIAGTLRTHLADTAPSELIFEVNSLASSRAALEAINIGDAVLLQRKPGNAHLLKAAEQISRSIGSIGAGDLVLTGCGLSIQAIQGMLSQSERDLSKNKVKAYWSPAKAGLD